MADEIIVDSGYNHLSTIIDQVAFFDPANKNYYLAKESPCLDAGTNLLSSGISFDLDNNPRPIGPAFDIGALETDTSALVWPEKTVIPKKLHIYPVPASRGVNIRFAGSGISLDEKIQLKLSNIKGNIFDLTAVRSSKSNAECTYRAELKGIPKGYYLLWYENEDLLFLGKLEVYNQNSNH